MIFLEFKNEADRFASQKKMAHGYVGALHEIWSTMRRFGVRERIPERPKTPGGFT